MKRYLPLIIIVALIWLYRLGAESNVNASATQAVQPYQANEWSVALAHRLGNQDPSESTLAFIDAWIQSEGTDAQYNPLATTQDMPGATCFNSVCVKNYLTVEDGVEATVMTLAQGYPGYNDIVMGIRNNDFRQALNGLEQSPWGTDAGLVKKVLAGKTSKVEKCPYTRTMAVASTFYSTDGPWGGQYGGYHLGDDFTGSEGDEVLAPFGMVIESTGRYEDSDRLGNNIQARFLQDGVLFYAGHLIEVFVSPGDVVDACTVIGTMGATDFKHTHIKLGGPNAPVPCELSQPGWDTGCIDPIEYWNSH